MELATTRTNQLPDIKFATARTALKIPIHPFRSLISQQRSTLDPAFSHTVELELTRTGVATYVGLIWHAETLQYGHVALH